MPVLLIFLPIWFKEMGLWVLLGKVSSIFQQTPGI